MTPFAAAQIRALIEDIRLMESFVTAPLGLHADIQMLRRSIPLPEAVDLSREEARERRIGHSSLTADPAQLALQSIDHVNSTLAILGTLAHDSDSSLSREWLARARRVLDRAEQRVGGDLRASIASRLQGLYVIVDPQATGGRPVFSVAEAALKGGAGVIQLRDKSHEGGDVLAAAKQMKSLCDEHGAVFVVNDEPAIARASDAHGLHLGRGDIPAPEARRILAHGQIVGLSNGSMEEVSTSLAAGVDYLAVGAVFPTSTVGNSARPAVGVQMVSKVKESASQPVVAIGGINLRNVAEVVRAGADCVCVVSAVALSDDPEASAGALVKAIHNAKR